MKTYMHQYVLILYIHKPFIGSSPVPPFNLYDVKLVNLF